MLAGALLKDTAGTTQTESPPNTGYLLFETADGGGDPVSAEKLRLNLHRRRVPLVILSVCQSATQGQGAGRVQRGGEMAFEDDDTTYERSS